MPRWSTVAPAVVFASLIGPWTADPATAQWKWLDKNKQVQYSDLPPPSAVAEEDILQRPGGAQRRASMTAPATAASAASAPPALMPKMVEPELEARRRKAEQDDAAKKAVEAEKVAAAKVENCNRAKSQLRTLDSGIRVARTNDKGEREILDDSARADETRRTREVISADCR